jgi:hypothetical protein
MVLRSTKTVSIQPTNFSMLLSTTLSRQYCLQSCPSSDILIIYVTHGLTIVDIIAVHRRPRNESPNFKLLFNCSMKNSGSRPETSKKNSITSSTTSTGKKSSIIYKSIYLNIESLIGKYNKKEKSREKLQQQPISK